MIKTRRIKKILGYPPKKPTILMMENNANTGTKTPEPKLNWDLKTGHWWPWNTSGNIALTSASPRTNQQQSSLIPTSGEVRS